VVTLLSVVIPVVIFGISKEKKCLVYDVIGGSIISKSDFIKTEDVKVLFGEEKLSNLDFQLITIKNDGKVPIKRQDFDKELTINYPKETRVLSAKVWKTIPNNLEAKVISDKNEIKLEPLLLNKDEKVIVQVLSTDKQNDPTVNARIVGLEYIKNNTPSAGDLGLRLNIYLIISLLAGFVYGATAFLVITKRKVIIPKFMIILIVISAALGSVTINNKYVLYKNLDRFSWPVFLLFVAVALGFIYSRLVLIPRTLSNNRELKIKMRDRFI